MAEEDDKLKAEKGINDEKAKNADLTRDAVEASRDLNIELLEILDKKRAQNEYDRSLLQLSRDISRSVTVQTKDLGRISQIRKQIAKEAKIASQATLEVLLLQKKLGKDYSTQAKSIANLNSDRIKASNDINNLEQELVNLVLENKEETKDYIDKTEQLKDLKSDLVKHDEDLLALTSGIENNDIKRLAVAYELQAQAKTAAQNRSQELKDRIELNKLLGFSGAAIEGIGGLLKNIGVESSIVTDILDEATSAMEDTAKETKSGVSTFTSGITTLLRSTLKNAFTFSNLALAASAALFVNFRRVNNASIEFVRLTGQIPGITDSLNGRLATTVQFLEVASNLTRNLGLSATSAFSSDTLFGAAELQNLLGLSAESAGRLALLTEVSNKNIDNSVEGLVDSVSEFNRVNRTAISQGVVLQDIADTSDDILAIFNGQADALGKAGAAARRLGLRLADVDGIASSLLNFETSIENELTAQLITGRNINLVKARELALSNQLGELSHELFNNSVSLLEFSEMNRIEQDALASALGLQRNQLARIALQRSLELGMSSKQLELAAGITAEELKRVTVLDELQLSLDKIAQALVVPASLLANMAEHGVILYGAIAGLAGLTLAKVVLQFAALATSATVTMSALTAGAIGAIIVGSLLAVSAAQRRATDTAVTSIQDGVISPSGGLVVSGPKGSFQLDKSDSVIAAPMTGLGNNRAVLDKLDRMIEVISKKGTVVLDGYKVGEALTLSTYNNS